MGKGQAPLTTTGTARHYNDVIMGAMVSQLTSRTFVYSAVYSGADQRKHQSSAALAFVRGIAGEFPAQRPVTRKMFPFDDVIMGARRVHIFCVCAVNVSEVRDERILSTFNKLNMKSKQFCK